MADRTLMEQIVLDEIQGKNTANHAYDRIIWSIRSGFVTLFFAAWGILATAIVSKDSNLATIVGLAFPVWVVSAGLAACAWLVDNNYLRRKFRVIAALNRVFASLVVHAREQPHGAGTSLPLDGLDRFLRVSGDTGDTAYRGAGYDEAWRAGAVIYALPCAIFAPVLVLVSWIL